MAGRAVEAGERSGTRSIEFGPFRLLPREQMLLDGDAPVPIGNRALQILCFLLERSGEVIGKNEIAERVWPGTYLEESNLRVHIASLRKAIRDGRGGNRFIVNVPGRGYSFVGSVHTRAAPATTEPEVAPSSRSVPGLPPALDRIIGRAEIVNEIGDELRQWRFITVVGPGGVGKTTVALAVARAAQHDHRDGIAFADLGAVSNPDLVPATLGSMLGLAVTGHDGAGAVASFLRDRQMLVLLDSCEHVVEAAAEIAERIISEAPGVSVLATSIEPLRAAGERVHRLLPLATPGVVDAITAEEALSYGGVQLFVERAAAGLGGYELSDADAPIVAEICQRLDGIALGIELAAARVPALGFRELAMRLDDRFRLLTSNRRTALPRHQTLAATLDWSYELLTDNSRKLLRHLSVLAGEFTLDTVLGMFGALPGIDVLTDLPELVGKSLVWVHRGVEPTRDRLLDTTRLYALGKLRLAGELEAARRVQAERLRHLFANAERDCERLPTDEWMLTYGRELDNVRAALDWAAAAAGDPALLVTLTAASVPLWVQLSLIGECRSRVERALEVVESVGLDPEVKRCRMHLTAALGWSLMYGAGRTAEIGAAWARTLALAEELGDNGYRLRAMWGMWIGRINRGDWTAGLDLARKLLAATEAGADAFERIMTERLYATTMHYLGDQRTARDYMERVLRRHAASGRQPRLARFQVDQKIAAHYFYARILWLLGHFDRARQLVHENVDEGVALGNALSFSSVLGQGACIVTLLSGDVDTARRFGTMLRTHAERHRIRLWHEWAECFEGVLELRDGGLENGLRNTRAALEAAGDAALLPRYMLLQGEFALGSGRAGDPSAGLRTIEALIGRCKETGEGWYLPEALRIKGELTRMAGGAEAEARAILATARTLAATQHARAWSLRIGVSRTRLDDEPEQRAELAGMVRELRHEGETADLGEAQRLLGT